MAAPAASAADSGWPRRFIIPSTTQAIASRDRGGLQNCAARPERKPYPFRLLRHVHTWHKADMPRCLQRTAGETRKVPLHLKQFQPQRLPVENQPVEQRPSGAPVSIRFLQRLHAAVKGQPTLPVP
jgi:hypothetical protein